MIYFLDCQRFLTVKILILVKKSQIMIIEKWKNILPIPFKVRFQSKFFREKFRNENIFCLGKAKRCEIFFKISKKMRKLSEHRFEFASLRNFFGNLRIANLKPCFETQQPYWNSDIAGIICDRGITSNLSGSKISPVLGCSWIGVRSSLRPEVHAFTSQFGAYSQRYVSWPHSIEIKNRSRRVLRSPRKHQNTWRAEFTRESLIQ